MSLKRRGSFRKVEKEKEAYLVCVRILGLALCEVVYVAESCVKGFTGAYPVPSGAWAAVRVQVLVIGMEIVFVKFLRIIPGNRVNGRGLLVAVAPVGRLVCLAGSFHPSRPVASQPKPG